MNSKEMQILIKLQDDLDYGIEKHNNTDEDFGFLRDSIKECINNMLEVPKELSRKAYDEVDTHLYDKNSGVRIDWLVSSIQDGLLTHIKWVD